MQIKGIKRVLAAAALVFSAASSAGVITDTKEVDTYVARIGDSASWTHDINDNGFELGSALSGTLSIQFWDDKDFFNAPEFATILVGSLDFNDGQLIYKPTSDWQGSLGINSLVSLNATGRLSVKVWSIFGDFYVGDSVLSVTTADEPAPVEVPEPSALFLLGLGLLGLGMLRRRV